MSERELIKSSLRQLARESVELMSIEEVEGLIREEMLTTALLHTDGNITKASLLLKVSRQAVQRQIQTRKRRRARMERM